MPTTQTNVVLDSPAAPPQQSLHIKGKHSNSSLLCVANARASSGFAWTFIGQLYAAVGNRMAEHGGRASVTYYSLNEALPMYEGTSVEPVEFRFTFGGLAGMYRALRFVRQRRVTILYLSDHPAWSLAYIPLRLAGVRRIVVHDHTSGDRDRPTGMRRMVKSVRHLIPGCTADAVIAVSDFVAARAREVSMVPPERVHRVWNSVAAPAVSRSEARKRLCAALGVPADRPIVACAARAFEYKGVHHLLRAFDRLDTDSTLVYFGRGPKLEEWRELRDNLASRDRIIFAGYRSDAPELMAGVDVAVVPSVWAEAFGMAALEPMAAGVPVVVSHVGGLSEVVADGETGIHVPPGDVDALAAALEDLLSDATMRRRMGRAGRERAARLFSRDQAVDALERIVLRH